MRPTTFGKSTGHSAEVGDAYPLPRSIHCERNILGALLINRDAFQAVVKLSPGDFHATQHSILFAACMSIHEVTGGVDLPILVDHLKSTGKLDSAGGLEYVAGLLDGMPVRFNIEQEVGSVLEAADRRELATLGDSLFRDALTGMFDASELLVRHHDSVNSVSARLRSRVWAETTRLSCSARDLFSAESEPTQWIVPGVVALGTVSVLSGKVKQAGKTTFALAAAAAAIRGTRFLDAQTIKTPVVYLTEQPRSSFREAVQRAQLVDSDLLRIIFWHEVYRQPWVEMARAAVELCKRCGAKLMIVDTLGQFAGIEGDDENNAGAALAAMKPLALAAVEGLAVLVLVHERKSGGEVGDAGRGSSAFAGAADNLLSLRRPEGNTRSSLRTLKGLGRSDGLIDSLTIELTPQGYKSHGSVTDVALVEAGTTILSILPHKADEAIPMKGIVGTTRLARATAQRALAALTGAGAVQQTGLGTKNDAFRFFRTKKDSAQTPNVDGQKES